MDPDGLNCAQVRLSRLGYLSNSADEIEYSRLELAISLSAIEVYASDWRIKTLEPVFAEHFRRKFKSHLEVFITI